MAICEADSISSLIFFYFYFGHCYHYHKLQETLTFLCECCHLHFHMTVAATDILTSSNKLADLFVKLINMGGFSLFFSLQVGKGC